MFDFRTKPLNLHKTNKYVPGKKFLDAWHGIDTVPSVDDRSAADYQERLDGILARQLAHQ